MLKFYKDAHSVKVDPVSLTIDPLLEIWMTDTSPNKEEAHKILSYIHLTSQIDRDAPYANVDPNDVSKLVKKELWRDYDHVITLGTITQERVDEIVLHYQAAFETADEAAVRVYDKKIYEMQRVIDTTKIEIKETVTRGATSYVSNFPIIDKMVQNIPKIVKARDELKAMILKQTTRETLKGKQKLSFADKRRRSLDATRKPEEEDPDDL